MARPELTDRVIILHARDPRRGQCVVACSRTAYRWGVRLGMPLAEAASVAPHAEDPLAGHSVSPSGRLRDPARQASSSLRERAPYIALHDPHADQAALEQLACWCEQFSPIVGFENQAAPGTPTPGEQINDCLFLDCTDLAAYFGDEYQLAGLVTKAFDERGYHVRVAVAATLGAAWAFARFATTQVHQLQAHPIGKGVTNGPDCQASTVRPTVFFPHGSAFRVVSSQATFTALQPLPVAALRLPSSTLSLLRHLGVYRIEQLSRLPRRSLSSRFGDLLLTRWDQALGLVDEALIAHHAPPEFQEDYFFESPTSRRETIQSALEELIRRIAGRLASREQGVVELVCRLRCGTGDRPAKEDSRQLPVPHQSARSLRMGLFRPTACPAHLLQLLRMQLEQLALSVPVEHVVVEATITAPLEHRQRELFVDAVRCDSQQLIQLINRLSSRLGERGVMRSQLQADAQPEYAYHYLPLTGRATGGIRRNRRSFQSASRRQVVRPLHLRASPLPVDVVAIAPHGPPVRLHIHQRRYRIVRHWGPERIETGWWRGPSIRRDYYRIETDSGHWLWLFRHRHDGRWFLHGMFG